jgi:hypothetical protein
MNNKTLLLSATLCLLTAGVFAQSTVFTYQGELNTNSVPYSGSAEMEFVLWDAAANGNSIAMNNAGSIITNVANGLFTVALDFGSNPFNGDPRFLEVSVRTAIGPLCPSQPGPTKKCATADISDRWLRIFTRPFISAAATQPSPPSIRKVSPWQPFKA